MKSSPRRVQEVPFRDYRTQVGMMSRRRSRVRPVQPRSEEFLASEWDKVAGDRDTLINDGRDLSYLYILLPALRKLSDGWLIPEGRVLDIGCGTGKFAAALAADYSESEVVGIDPSRISIEIAAERRNSLANLRFFPISAEDFSGSGHAGQFELIVANMLFQNVARLDEVLAACVKLLRPNGALVFAVPHPCFWPRYWKYEKEPWFKYGRELWIEAPFRTSLSPDATLRTTHTHRPLSGYVNAFRAAGFFVDEIVEPYPDEGIEGEYPIAWEFPRFLLGRCVLKPDQTR